jgi:hypothetical protein
MGSEIFVSGNERAVVTGSFLLQGCPHSLILHMYIASLLHSYSINSVLHLLSPTIRDSRAWGRAPGAGLTRFSMQWLAEAVRYSRGFVITLQHASKREA